MGLGVVSAVASPLISVVVGFGFLYFLPLEEMQRVQLLMFAALPPAVLNYMFAEKYNQHSAEVASMVVVANAFSVFVLALMLIYLNLA